METALKWKNEILKKRPKAVVRDNAKRRETIYNRKIP